ncbi:MAG: YraN family protein [Victivallaceae bacterium]|nr:YraN family protein [Victivallaceae bacterium]
MISQKARAAHLRLGRRGERVAARLLKTKGFEILSRDWRRGSGELDIVARDGAMLVFVEVKTKRAGSRSRPMENLSRAQISRIRRGAVKYIASVGLDHETFYRFDLVEVVLSRWRANAVYHHEYCYRAGGR